MLIAMPLLCETLPSLPMVILKLVATAGPRRPATALLIDSDKPFLSKPTATPRAMLSLPLLVSVLAKPISPLYRAVADAVPLRLKRLLPAEAEVSASPASAAGARANMVEVVSIISVRFIACSPCLARVGLRPPHSYCSPYGRAAAGSNSRKSKKKPRRMTESTISES